MFVGNQALNFEGLYLTKILNCYQDQERECCKEKERPEKSHWEIEPPIILIDKFFPC